MEGRRVGVAGEAADFVIRRIAGYVDDGPPVETDRANEGGRIERVRSVLPVTFIYDRVAAQPYGELNQPTSPSSGVGSTSSARNRSLARVPHPAMSMPRGIGSRHTLHTRGRGYAASDLSASTL